jgi:uncharacterized protein (UPF0335 family)
MNTTNNQIRSIVERVENIEREIKERNSDKKEIYAEAKANGFDVKALKAVISRRRNPEATAEADAIIELYECALGTGAPRAGAREEAA